MCRDDTKHSSQTIRCSGGAAIVNNSRSHTFANDLSTSVSSRQMKTQHAARAAIALLPELIAINQMRDIDDEAKIWRVRDRLFGASPTAQMPNEKCSMIDAQWADSTPQDCSVPPRSFSTLLPRLHAISTLFPRSMKSQVPDLHAISTFPRYLHAICGGGRGGARTSQ